MRLLLQRVLGLLALCWSGTAGAHAMRTAYLELVEQEQRVYTATWTTTVGEAGVKPVMPAACTELATASPAGEAPTKAASLGANVNARSLRLYSLACPTGLAGRELSVHGLGATINEAIVQLIPRGGEPQTAVLTARSPTWTVPAEPTPLAVAREYVVQGFWHILEGPDHLLFLLALLLLIGDPRRIILTATAFTLAHSITLALSILRVVHAPGPAVEAAIALSMVLVALDVGRPGRGTGHAGPVMGFCFGLVHGFGFAGALAEVGLPQAAIPLALAAFNVGVEIGQVVFVVATLGLWRLAARRGLERGFAMAGAYGVGVLGVYWLLERIGSFQ